MLFSKRDGLANVANLQADMSALEGEVSSHA